MLESSRPAAKGLSGIRPLCIGFLTDWLDHSYHWRSLRSATQAAYDGGASLLAFVGGAITASPDESSTNWLYELARPSNVDGLVMLSGSLGNRVGPEGLLRFARTCGPVPICSIAVPFPESSSVAVDNATGMRLVVEHLIQTHGLRQIAFVRGPAASAEAELRLQVYRETLEANGIAYDPDLVVSGNFMRWSGQQAITTLLVDRKLPVSAVSAVVAANDSMALGAMDELRRLGIKVPEQVAVAGFDDVDESRCVLPPLTTALQPLRELGAQAVHMVIDQVRNGAAPVQAVRRTELVVRRSCGCLADGSGGRLSSLPPPTYLGFDGELIRKRQPILGDLARAGRGELGVAAGAQWDVRLLTAAAEQIRGDSPHEFLRTYDEIVRRAVLAGVRTVVCSDVLTTLRGHLLRCIGDSAKHAEAETMFDEARIILMNALEGIHVEARVRRENGTRFVTRAGAAMLAARDIGELARVVHDHLPKLGIPRCFVMHVVDGPQGLKARVVIAEKPDARKSDPVAWSEFPAVDIFRRVVLPEGEQRAFAVFPALFADEHRGLVVLEIGALEDFACETLRQLLSASLRRMAPGPASIGLTSVPPRAR
jgi:DNA-binding LacI/PurR family transcriptional regulator